MFYLFQNDVLTMVIGNKIGDIFYDLLATKQNLPIEQLKLVSFGNYSALLNEVGEGVKEEISPEQIIIKDAQDNVRFIVTGTIFAEGNVKHFPC